MKFLKKLLIRSIILVAALALLLLLGGLGLSLLNKRPSSTNVASSIKEINSVALSEYLNRKQKDAAQIKNGCIDLLDEETQSLFKPLSPVNVSLCKDGISLLLYTFWVEHTGVFITFNSNQQCNDLKLVGDCESLSSNTFYFFDPG